MDDDYQPVRHMMSAAASRPALVKRIHVEFIVVVKVCGYAAALAVFTNIFYGLIFGGAVLMFCRMLTMQDDQAFRIMGLWFKTRIVHFNWNRRYWNYSRYGNTTRF